VPVEPPVLVLPPVPVLPPVSLLPPVPVLPPVPILPPVLVLPPVPVLPPVSSSPPVPPFDPEGLEQPTISATISRDRVRRFIDDLRPPSHTEGAGPSIAGHCFANDASMNGGKV